MTIIVDLSKFITVIVFSFLKILFKFILRYFHFSQKSTFQQTISQIGYDAGQTVDICFKKINRNIFYSHKIFEKFLIWGYDNQNTKPENNVSCDFMAIHFFLKQHFFSISSKYFENHKYRKRKHSNHKTYEQQTVFLCHLFILIF